MRSSDVSPLEYLKPIMSKQSSHFVIFAALLLTLISFTVVAGWIFKVAMLVQLRNVWVPMQFNTAICFLLCAAGLICLEFGKLKSATAFSAIVLTIAGVTLSEFIFGFNCGLDTCVIKHPFVTTATSHIGRMSPLTTITFILNGTAPPFRSKLSTDQARHPYFGIPRAGSGRLFGDVSSRLFYWSAICLWFNRIYLHGPSYRGVNPPC